MRIIERYILKEFIKSVFYCLGVFVFLYIMADLFNYIDEMIRNHVPIKSVLIYYSTFVPSIFVQVTPIAVLLSTVYILSTFNRHNEITALRVSGISLWSIIKPLLVTGFLLSLLVFIVNDKIVPRAFAISSRIKKEEIRDAKKDKKSDKLLKDIALYSTGNRIIYVQSFDPAENVLKEIIVLEHDNNQNLVRKTSAMEARWEENKWIFYDTSTHKLDAASNIIGAPLFSKKKVYDLEESPEDFKRLQWRTEFMNYAQLKNYINRFSESGLKSIRQLLVDLHYKVSFALVSVIVILVAAPLSLLPVRGGILMGIGISIIVALAYYAVSAITLALGKAGMFPPFIAAWMANFLFLGLGIFLMKKKK